MSLKFTKAEQGKIIAKNEAAQSITVDGVVAQVGVVDGIQVSAAALKDSSRWLLGRPLKLNGRKIGQVDEAILLGDQKVSVKASIMAFKLSDEELRSMLPEGDFNLRAGFFPITRQQDGTVGGEPFKETATSIEWDHIVLEIPEMKSHSAEGRWDRLEKLNRQMDAALGR